MNNSARKKIIMVFGTRPEAIKMAPLAHALMAAPEFEFKLCITAQHRTMLDQVLELFKLRPDYDLNIMKDGQDLYEISAQILQRIKPIFLEMQPDIVLVHGDTTTTFIVSLAAYYQRIKVGHVEAGLRTHNIFLPWPEEANRRMTGTIAQFHFAPTEHAKQNLLNENIPAETICVTGNTVIDALQVIEGQITSDDMLRKQLVHQLQESGFSYNAQRRIVLITGHRRENFGESFLQICEAIKALAQQNPDIDFVYPVHMNPNVRKPVYAVLDKRPNVYLIEPLSYTPFVFIMMHAHVILTDSGGLQEEAPALGKPVLVMRNTTERPEAITAGTSKLVGTSCQDIQEGVQSLLDDDALYRSFATKVNPFGDGHACDRIVSYLREHL